MNPGAVVLSRSGAAVAADFSNATGAPIVGDADTGNIYWFANGTPFPIGFPNVGGFGASPSYSAAVNTAAFNLAIASSSVIFVPGGPEVVYDLNALNPYTASKIIFGSATLRFNTTGDCITASQASSSQSKNTIISGLSFKNTGSVPASFIRNSGFLNAIFEKLHFDGCAATHCIDNYYGYGTTINKCTFTDVTGSAARLRDDGGSTKYSYAFSVNDCDLTRISANGFDVDGTGCLKFTDTVFVTITGDAVRTNASGGSAVPSIQGWNITFDTCYFESNTGYDINLLTDGTNYWGEAVLLSCKFAGAPTINLGSLSVITAINSRAVSGGDPVIVSGSANATATLINSTLFSQSGSFYWSSITSGTSGNTSYLSTRGLLAFQPTRTAGYKMVFGDPDTAGNNFLGIYQATDNTNIVGLQGAQNGTGAQAIPLNPLGGAVLAGTFTDDGVSKFQSSGPIRALSATGYLDITDGITAPGTGTGARIYVDSADGDLKIKFADGIVKTIVVDT